MRDRKRERLILSTHPFPLAFLHLHAEVLLVLLESYEQDQILEDLIGELSARKMGRELGKQRTHLIMMQVDSKRRKERGLLIRPTKTQLRLLSSQRKVLETTEEASSQSGHWGSLHL